MEPTDTSPRLSSAGDLAYGIFYSGAIGGCVVALVFLATDAMAGQPLFTPSLLGSVVFAGQGAEEVMGVNLAAVALFTVVHFVAFGCLGVLATVLFRATLARDMAPTVITGIVLFAVMQGGISLASRTVLPGIMQALGTATVITANALTALAMVLFLKNTLAPAPPEVQESEEELMEGPGLT